jgi:hypothetical protein
LRQLFHQLRLSRYFLVAQEVMLRQWGQEGPEEVFRTVLQVRIDPDKPFKLTFFNYFLLRKHLLSIKNLIQINLIINFY